MSKQKKLMAGHESAQTEGQIDRRTDRVIPRGYNKTICSVLYSPTHDCVTI